MHFSPPSQTLALLDLRRRCENNQAYGDAVCSVLNFLTDKALAASGFAWRRPVYPAEEAAEEAEPVDDCDMADIVDEAEVEEEEEEQDFSELNKVCVHRSPDWCFRPFEYGGVTRTTLAFFFFLHTLAE